MSEAAPTAAIVLEHVHKSFGAAHVLRDVSLRVAAGERVVVCGPSGSGKSTMIRCINRLEAHDRGPHLGFGIALPGDRVGGTGDAAEALYDARFVRMWEFYLALCEVGFRYRTNMVFQVQLARQQEAVPLTRDYMLRGERALAWSGPEPVSLGRKLG